VREEYRPKTIPGRRPAWSPARLSAALAVVVVVVAVWAWRGPISHQLALSFVRQPVASYVELSFANPLALPTSLPGGAVGRFSFVVVVHGHPARLTRYVVTMAAGARTSVVALGSVPVQEGAPFRVRETFRAPGPGASYLVSVRVEPGGPFIDFHGTAS
jgi:hypothetical protein